MWDHFRQLTVFLVTFAHATFVLVTRGYLGQIEFLKFLCYIFSKSGEQDVTKIFWKLQQPYFYHIRRAAQF